MINSPNDSGLQSATHLNADLAPGLGLNKESHSNFGTIDFNGTVGSGAGLKNPNSSKLPSNRFSNIDSQ